MLTGSDKFCKLIDMPIEPTQTPLVGILLAAAGSAFLFVFCIVLIVNSTCEKSSPKFSLRAAVLFMLSFGLLLLGLSLWRQADEAWTRYNAEVKRFREEQEQKEQKEQKEQYQKVVESLKHFRAGSENVSSHRRSGQSQTSTSP